MNELKNDFGGNAKRTPKPKENEDFEKAKDAIEKELKESRNARRDNEEDKAP